MQTTAAKTKIDYIDNLRILMTALVILHHTLIAYGAPGGWYFTDATANVPARLVMTVLVATNQSFFMGFFFFLSAYFIQPSYNKKGALRFTTDRLRRLGIPLLWYTLLLGPAMNFLIYKYGRHKPATFFQYLAGYDDWIDFGVLWFVAALLLFTLVYVLVKRAGSRRSLALSFPGNGAVFLSGVALGVVSYVVRIFFPLGWVLHPVGFQLAHFTQYICLFYLGIVAYNNQWMAAISCQTGKRWLLMAAGMVLIGLPALIVALKGEVSAAAGGGTWQSLVAALWEQITGIAIIIGLSGVARQRWNATTPLLQKASRAAFATYIFHPLVVICLTLLMLPWQTDPVYKLLVAAPCAIVFSFGLGWLVTRLPGAKKIV